MFEGSKYSKKPSLFNTFLSMFRRIDSLLTLRKTISAKKGILVKFSWSLSHEGFNKD